MIKDAIANNRKAASPTVFPSSTGGRFGTAGSPAHDSLSIIRKCSKLLNLFDRASEVRYAEAASLGPPAAGKLSNQSAVSAPNFIPVRRPTGIVDVNVLYHSLLGLASCVVKLKEVSGALTRHGD